MFVICGCIRYTLTEVSSISDVRYITLLTMEHIAAVFTGIQAITVRIIPVVIIIRCIKVISTLVRSSENMTLSLLGRLRIPDIILLRHDLQLRQHPLIVLRHVRHIVRV